MIRTVADLLRALQKEEIRKIEEQGIRHAPTIGAQYEGLTASLLATLLPTDALQIVSGFVEGSDGKRSGQIDCMLVNGSGTPVLYTNLSIWPIKDVFAVLEVKKTLKGTELKDAQEHLTEILDLQNSDFAAQKPGTCEDLTPSFQAYSQIVGSVVPYPTGLDELPIDRQAIYWSVVHGQLAPLRIIFAYGGFRSEHSLRRGFIKVLEKNGHSPGFAGDSLPSLIVCEGNCLVKTNGHPYSFKMIKDEWVVYASSVENPLVILLNVILTKLSHRFLMPLWFDADLSNERLTPLLFGRFGVAGDKEGWIYATYNLSHRELAVVKAKGRADDWAPLVISVYQATVLSLLGAMTKLGRRELLALREDGDEAKAIAELESLQTERIIGLDGEEFTLITLECTTVFGPWGDIVAADNSSGRLTQWVAQQEKLRKAKKRANS